MGRCRTPRPGRACVLGLLLVVSGCRPRGLDACIELVEAKRHDEALRRCEQVWAAASEPRAGAALARAHYELKHHDRFFDWLRRLEGTAGEPGLWSLAAAIH